MAFLEIGQTLRGVNSWAAIPWRTGLERAGRGLVFAASAGLIAQVGDATISQLLVVDTLRHGTNPINWLKIQLVGGDPNTGKNRSGVECTGQLYVWRDSRRVKDVAESLKVKYEGPILYSGFMGEAAWKYGGVRLKVLFSWCVVRFHVRPQDQDSHSYWDTSRNDHDYPDFMSNPRILGTTLFTSKRLGWSHTGIFGSICQGVNGGLPRRIYYNPKRFAKGLALSLVAIPLTAYWINQLPFPSIANSKMVAWAGPFSNQLGYLEQQALAWKIVCYPLEGLRWVLGASSLEEVIYGLGILSLWTVSF